MAKYSDDYLQYLQGQQGNSLKNPTYQKMYGMSYETNPVGSPKMYGMSYDMMPVPGSSAFYDPFQNMTTRGARKKKKNERPLPQGTLFGPMGAIGGLFGGGG